MMAAVWNSSSDAGSMLVDVLYPMAPENGRPRLMVRPIVSFEGNEPFPVFTDEVTTDCPLRSRDPLPSCEGLRASQVYEHIEHTHLAGTSYTVTSYRSMLRFRSQSLRHAAETMGSEGHPGFAQELDAKAAEFEKLVEGIDAAGRAI